MTTQIVLEALEYAGTEGLVTTADAGVPPDRAYVWQEARAKFDIDAAFFHGSVPVVYFKGLEAASDTELARLHRQLWNHNRVPLLVAILPEEVRVYNCFAPPRPLFSLSDTDHGPSLFTAVELVTDVLEMRRRLAPYRREEVESGRLAQGESFDRSHRAHSRLLANLRQVRLALYQQGLAWPVINSLLGRSIFVRYLEDRGVLRSGFFAEFGGAANYRELLRRSVFQTYRLFQFLKEKFNGDMFPVEPVEEKAVTSEHLDLLGRFLSGDEVSTGQMYFWAYDFNYIPIELISSIYEEFLNEDKSHVGAYYTPPEIVGFVLNEMLPWDGLGADRSRVLDPACGSGIFLVEAYRRLVERERYHRGGARPDVDVLSDILTECIYGVDISREAIQVAAFSCYLALLDFVEPKSIWDRVRFPKLVDSNLVVADFFDTQASFSTRRYDVIVGNPPWRSRVAEHIRSYLSATGHPIGDKQIAHAFLWRVPELLDRGGRACLLAPSKGLLFNRSAPNVAFRREFFAAHVVSAVVDFSLFRRSLFENATAPMAAIFYRPKDATTQRSDIRYCTPHPSPLAESVAGVIISGDEIKRLAWRRVIEDADVWKIALWGTARDLAFIEDLRRRFPPLGEVAQRRGWVFRQGGIVGGAPTHTIPELTELPFIAPQDLYPFDVRAPRDKRTPARALRRPTEPAIYRAPHVVLRRSVLRGGRIAAAFLPYDAFFTDSYGIAGPPGDTALLKVVSAYLNSSLARYYHFLTASSWGIERDKIELNEHKSFPCAFPSAGRSTIDVIAALVDKIQGTDDANAWQSELDALVFDAYGLTEAERTLIADTLDFALDTFYRGTRSHAYSLASPGELVRYAEAFKSVINGALSAHSSGFDAIVYASAAPFCAVSFRLIDSALRDRAPVVETDANLDRALAELDAALQRDVTAGLYLRRSVKVFGTRTVHIVKPSERRYWTRSAAFNDADEVVVRLLSAAQVSAV